MSRSENVELTLRACDAFNGRDWEAFSALMHPDVEVESRLVAMEGAYKGESGLRDWRDAITGFLPDYTVEVQNIRDVGDLVLVHSVGTAHGATSATPVHDPFWQVLEWAIAARSAARG